MKTCRSCGGLLVESGSSPYNRGSKYSCIDPFCSSGPGRGGEGGGGSNWLTKPCRDCGAEIQYKAEWSHPPNYCQDCKSKFQAGTIGYNKDQKQWHQHDGRGRVRDDGGIEFAGEQEDHTHITYDRNLQNPREAPGRRPGK